MVFRHPHVFGQARADDCAQALDTWDAQKREEKDQRTAADTLTGGGPLPPRPDPGGEGAEQGRQGGL